MRSPADRRTTGRLPPVMACAVADAGHGVTEVADYYGVSWPSARAAVVAPLQDVLREPEPTPVPGIDEPRRGGLRCAFSSEAARWVRTDANDAATKVRLQVQAAENRNPKKATRHPSRSYNSRAGHRVHGDQQEKRRGGPFGHLHHRSRTRSSSRTRRPVPTTMGIRISLDELETHQIAGTRYFDPGYRAWPNKTWALLLTDCAIRNSMREATDDVGIGTDRLSFIRSLRVIHRQVILQAAFSPHRLQTDIADTLAGILARRNTPCQRSYPRVVKRKPAGPKIINTLPEGSFTTNPLHCNFSA